MASERESVGGAEAEFRRGGSSPADLIDTIYVQDQSSLHKV